MDDAVNRCMKEDNVCTAEVLAALDLLAAKATLMPCYGCASTIYGGGTLTSTGTIMRIRAFATTGGSVGGR
jgi:hypothetical protein